MTDVPATKDVVHVGRLQAIPEGVELTVPEPWVLTVSVFCDPEELGVNVAVT